MDVILHLGAHRTGNKTFQDYMRRHAGALATRGVAFWGPRRMGHGFHGAVSPDPAEEQLFAARLRRALDRAERRGVRRLVVSDPHMLGSMAENIARGDLYPDLEERMARCAGLFDGRVRGVILSTRNLPRFWMSSLAAAVEAGAAVPGPEQIAAIARGPRSWRDVIDDVAAGLPDVPLRVLPFECYCGRPDAFLAQGAGIDAPFDRQRACLGRAPALPALRRALNLRGASGAVLPFGIGPWNPFTNEEHAILREKQADDMMWLTAGAGGLATLTEDKLRDRAGTTLPDAACKEGLRDEHEDRQMARPG